ncbi:MAG: hypothetical protein WCS85_00230 [Candidatus Peribacteraceae bacterium]|jgi:hypothetical protein
MPPITAGDVMLFLYILVGIMLLIALYHLLFILVDLRRVLKRVDELTKQVETFILKPIAIMDEILTAVVALFDKDKKKGKGKGFDHKKVS